jgi:hypothetical protein
MAPGIGGAHQISEYVKRVSGSEPCVCGIQPNSGLGEIATERIRYPEVNIVMPRDRYRCGSAICVCQRGGVVRVLCLGYSGTTRVRRTKNAHCSRRRTLISTAVVNDFISYAIGDAECVITTVKLMEVGEIRLTNQLRVISSAVINKLSLFNDIATAEQILLTRKCESLAIIVCFDSAFGDGRIPRYGAVHSNCYLLEAFHSNSLCAQT